MPEILAPCGSLEALSAALRCGCDAVYLGGECFSARQNAENFTAEQLKQAVFECHKRGVRVYQAINTVIFDSQLDECMNAVKTAAEIGVDALITQDLALVEVVKKCCPDMEIHASTQMTVHTEKGVEMTKRLGFSRTVLSRELPLEIIEKLSQLGIETEVFVHGALCMSVSGQCYMSGVIGSRSANRGLCAQACRLPVSAVVGKERYDLSLKDMSYLSQIKSLENAGVSSLKIEGRMKRPEYVGKSVDSCRKALNGEPFDVSELEAVFSRSGFTDGYLYRKYGREMFGTRQKDDVASTAKILPKLHELYRREDKRDTINFDFHAKEGEECILKAVDSKGICAEVKGEIPEKALNKPLDKELLTKQLSKLGDTIYNLGKITADIGEGLRISPSAINEMRRNVCMLLDKKRAGSNTKIVPFSYENLLDFERAEPYKSPQIRICVTDISQLEKVDFEKIQLVSVPIDLVHKYKDSGYPLNKVMVRMPRFTFDEEKQERQLCEIKKLGVTKMLATNIAHCMLADKYGFELHTDFGFNITNSCALNALKKLGAADSVVSFELKASQISALKKPLPVGFIAYGRLPLMLTVNCPISQAVGCQKCSGRLIDRTNREFPVKCSKKLGYTEVMNSDLLWLADKLDDFRGASFYQLEFFDENSTRVRDIIESYTDGFGKKPDTITRGLYFRGVL